ncbi:MAG: DUF309 domain-containing protein [Bacteroidota bacterium]|nr:DUF309 domain-containing protein [Bacteroidota bacterium]
MKRKIENNNNTAPIDVAFTNEDWEEFERAVNYFNDGQINHAQEAWELLWERCDKNERRFLRGLLEFASGCKKLVDTKVYHRAASDFKRANEKLRQFQPEFCGVPLQPIFDFLDQIANRNDDKYNYDSRNLSHHLLPTIHFHKPCNPDLLVEVSDILHAEQFVEGVKMFNKGYYWEAHEAWEEIWRDQTGDGRCFIEAFVQAAEGYNFAKTGKAGTAIYCFEKSIKKLRGFERVNCDINLCSFLDDTNTILVQLRAVSNNGKSQFKFPKPPCISYNAKFRS